MNSTAATGAWRFTKACRSLRSSCSGLVMLSGVRAEATRPASSTPTTMMPPLWLAKAATSLANSCSAVQAGRGLGVGP